MSRVVVSNVGVTYGDKHILSQVNLEFGAGELVVILGGNGAGKSTLMKSALGVLEPTTGEVTVNSESVSTMAPLAKAQLMSYLPQRRPMAWPILVRDVIALGRFAYGATLGRLSDEDEAAVERAIQACDLADFTDRSVDTLSGGEMTRVHCARTFASEAPLLFADEPTTALDPRHQLDIMQRLRSYVNAERGALVVAHEPALAARFADRLVWMAGGRIVADGPPSETLTEGTLAEVYRVSSKVSFENGHPTVDILDSIQG